MTGTKHIKTSTGENDPPERQARWLFAVQPKPPSVDFSVDLPSIEWINGRGQAMSLPL